MDKGVTKHNKWVEKIMGDGRQTHTSMMEEALAEKVRMHLLETMKERGLDADTYFGTPPKLPCTEDADKKLFGQVYYIQYQSNAENAVYLGMLMGGHTHRRTHIFGRGPCGPRPKMCARACVLPS